MVLEGKPSRKYANEDIGPHKGGAVVDVTTLVLWAGYYMGPGVAAVSSGRLHTMGVLFLCKLVAIIYRSLTISRYTLNPKM